MHRSVEEVPAAGSTDDAGRGWTIVAPGAQWPGRSAQLELPGGEVVLATVRGSDPPILVVPP